MDILAYVAAARKKHLDDATIHNNLVAAGWNAERVKAALKAKISDDLPVPTPPANEARSLGGNNNNEPIAVVHNLSNRGFEYFIMFIALAASAFSLGSLLHWVVDSISVGSKADATAPLSACAALIITLPIFLFMTIRLQRAEKAQPQLLQDQSRKRALQLTLVIAFVVGIGYLIAYLSSLFEGPELQYNYDLYSSESGNMTGISESLASFLHMLITLSIAGGIFAYYWKQLQLDKKK